MPEADSKHPDPATLAPPSDGELEVLGVLWDADAQGATALRLSEVRELLALRGKESELTTVSTQLRSLLKKGWLTRHDVSLASALMIRTRGAIAPSGSMKTRGAVRTRGALATRGAVRTRGTLETKGAIRSAEPPTRSPFTAYSPKYKPGEAFQPMFKMLAACYPTQSRKQMLVDAARALGFPEDAVTEIEKFVGDVVIK